MKFFFIFVLMMVAVMLIPSKSFAKQRKSCQNQLAQLHDMQLEFQEMENRFQYIEFRNKVARFVKGFFT